MKIDKFKDIIEEFVGDNFVADGCRECHEVGHNIVPEDSYDKAVEKLYAKVIGK